MRKLLVALLIFLPIHTFAQNQTFSVSAYVDSLKAARTRIDSLQPKTDAEAALIALPVAYYPELAKRALTGELTPAEQRLLQTWLQQPQDVVTTIQNDSIDTEELDPPVLHIDQPQPPQNDIVFIPEADVVVKKPNFWTFSGEYYLQLMQNFVSGNWYKGGESSYAFLTTANLQANYNNKQKITFDNLLELKLGMLHARTDSLHRYKASEDLIRYTGKLGIQAHKNWYYSLQLIAYTQFTKGYKTNDPELYSDFLAPFNANLALGITYLIHDKKERLTGSILIAPLAANWKYTRHIELAPTLGIDEGKHSLLDYGSSITLQIEYKPNNNVKLQSRLYAYTTYHRAEIEFENTLTFQLSKYIAANFYVYPRFDDNTTRYHHHAYWQFMERSSVGFTYSF